MKQAGGLRGRLLPLCAARDESRQRRSPKDSLRRRRVTPREARGSEEEVTAKRRGSGLGGLQAAR